MKFADMPAGQSIFVDANTLVYHFAPDPVFGPPSTDLLIRVRRGEVSGFTSTHVVSEMAHRLMTMEAMQIFGWPYAGIAQRLRKHPSEVRQLTAFRQAIGEVPRYGLQVLVIAADLLDIAAAISQQTGLLSNDALIRSSRRTLRRWRFGNTPLPSTGAAKSGSVSSEILPNPRRFRQLRAETDWLLRPHLRPKLVLLEQAVDCGG